MEHSTRILNPLLLRVGRGFLGLILLGWLFRALRCLAVQHHPQIFPLCKITCVWIFLVAFDVDLGVAEVDAAKSNKSLCQLDFLGDDIPEL